MTKSFVRGAPKSALEFGLKLREARPDRDTFLTKSFVSFVRGAPKSALEFGLKLGEARPGRNTCLTKSFVRGALCHHNALACMSAPFFQITSATIVAKLCHHNVLVLACMFAPLSNHICHHSGKALPS